MRRKGLAIHLVSRVPSPLFSASSSWNRQMVRNLLHTCFQQQFNFNIWTEIEWATLCFSFGCFWSDSISQRRNCWQPFDRPTQYRDDKPATTRDGLSPEPNKVPKRHRGKDHINDGGRMAATTNDEDGQSTIYQDSQSLKVMSCTMALV